MQDGKDEALALGELAEGPAGPFTPTGLSLGCGPSPEPRTAGPSCHSDPLEAVPREGVSVGEGQAPEAPRPRGPGQEEPPEAARDGPGRSRRVPSRLGFF